MFNRRVAASQDFDSIQTDGQEYTHRPRVLARQARLDQIEERDSGQNSTQPEHQVQQQEQQKSNIKWFPRLTGPKALRSKLSEKIARISSLDSTRSSSSVEMEPNGYKQTLKQRNIDMPLISVTQMNDTSSQRMIEEPEYQEGPESERYDEEFRRGQYNDFYDRPRNNGADNFYDYDERGGGGADDDDNDDDDDDDDDDFGNIYSGSYRHKANYNIKHPDGTSQSLASYYEDLLDDRQGMNKSEEQFTKGERMNRPSLDGSIVSEFSRLDMNSKKSGGLKGNREDKQRRSKSPSSSSGSNMRGRYRTRHSRRGFLGMASNFKLTRRHDSIAKLQLSILNSGFVKKRLKTLDKDLQTFLPKEKMTPAEFDERVKLMRKYEVLANIEYRFASRYEIYVCRHATREINQPKNNSRKCIPYDYNRVVLRTIKDIPDSDYINASHVDGYLKPMAYIAAQGPNENTIEDFWRMIWEQKTFVIVMLTKVFDFIRVMCTQYWPVAVNKPERYGNLEVTLLYEEPLADFVIRTIKLTKLRANQIRDDQNKNATSGADGQTADEVRVKSDGANSDECSNNDDDDDYEAWSSDVSEELIVNDESSPIEGGQPRVRSPRYLSKPKRRAQGQHSDNSASVASRKASRSTSDKDRPKRLNLEPLQFDLNENKSSKEFLNLPNLSPGVLSASSGSIPSMPNTPATPRTPGSAGIDRLSATRKAVKKKRRAGVKNKRPNRTQFLVPSESQLVDDDLEDEDEENGAEEGKSNERIIYQFHYNSWASHTCPFINSLLHFRRRVKICMDEMSKSGKTGPTVVHCNDGCGRTGTYLCIDANLELADEDNLYDVYNYTKKMRQSRKFLIENLEQYKFVYDTIEEAMFCGRTWFPVSELHTRLKLKSQRHPITKQNEYSREYEKITRKTSKFSIGDCAGGHRVENRDKNRDVSTVPPDNFRPYLTSFQSNDNTDYINAVFVDGYTRSKEYIVTEWPSFKTITDFWSLVFDHDCNSIILLANPPESYTYPSFLPGEKEITRKFSKVFSAEMISYTHYPNIKSWTYSVRKKVLSMAELLVGQKTESKITQVFQITCWPQSHRVPTSTNALVELMNMVERWRQRTAYGPVCVVSLDGKSRAGVYCAANVAIEQVVQHSEVDVFQAVKTVRRHRPQLIENLTEYKYCYDLILHYVIHYLNQPTAS